MKWLVLGAIGITPSLMIAQVQPDPSESFTSLLTGSAVMVLAAAVIAFLRGWVVTGKEHQRVIEERDKATDANNARADEDRRLLIPLLSR